jgi:hypothetical protein
MIRRIAFALLAFSSFTVYAQPDCSPASTTPGTAWHETRLDWDAPLVWTGGETGPIPPNPQFSYTVYRQLGAGAWTAQCITSVTTVSLLNQPAGAYSYRITAKTPLSTPPNMEGLPSIAVSKTIVKPDVIPEPPRNLSILDQLIAFIKRLWGRFA